MAQHPIETSGLIDTFNSRYCHLSAGLVNRVPTWQICLSSLAASRLVLIPDTVLSAVVLIFIVVMHHAMFQSIYQTIYQAIYRAIYRGMFHSYVSSDVSSYVSSYVSELRFKATFQTMYNPTHNPMQAPPLRWRHTYLTCTLWLHTKIYCPGGCYCCAARPRCFSLKCHTYV